MKGKLRKAEHNEWIVEHDGQTFQLHPDDVEDLLDLERRFDFIEGRIAASPEVEFTIVEHQKLTGTATYAKLIQL